MSRGRHLYHHVNQSFPDLFRRQSSLTIVEVRRPRIRRPLYNSKLELLKLLSFDASALR